MVSDIEVDMVADMEVDKVADMAAEMFKTKCIGPKLFDAKTCVSSKLCKFSWHL